MSGDTGAPFFPALLHRKEMTGMMGGGRREPYRTIRVSYYMNDDTVSKVSVFYIFEVRGPIAAQRGATGHPGLSCGGCRARVAVKCEDPEAGQTHCVFPAPASRGINSSSCSFLAAESQHPRCVSRERERGMDHSGVGSSIFVSLQVEPRRLEWNRRAGAGKDGWTGISAASFQGPLSHEDSLVFVAGARAEGKMWSAAGLNHVSAKTTVDSPEPGGHGQGILRKKQPPSTWRRETVWAWRVTPDFAVRAAPARFFCKQLGGWGLRKCHATSPFDRLFGASGRNPARQGWLFVPLDCISAKIARLFCDCCASGPPDEEALADLTQPVPGAKVISNERKILASASSSIFFKQDVLEDLSVCRSKPLVLVSFPRLRALSLTPRKNTSSSSIQTIQEFWGLVSSNPVFFKSARR